MNNVLFAASAFWGLPLLAAIVAGMGGMLSKRVRRALVQNVYGPVDTRLDADLLAALEGQALKI